MALEDANYISQLVPSNPPGTDQAATTDDHLRVVKRAVYQSLPNINGVVNCTPAQLNGLVGLGNNRIVRTNASGVLTASSSYPTSILDKIVTALTASRALVSDGSGIINASSVTSTELGYVAGVTSAIQTQIDGKSSTSHDHTGTEPQIGTNGLANDAVTAAKLSNATDDVATWVIPVATPMVIPAGRYVVARASIATNMYYEIRTDAGVWYGGRFDAGVIISDGTHMRLSVTGATETVYYRKVS
jgi:hypothetical protein